MIIYEVNLNIDREIYSEYKLWLMDHAKEMLQFQGFIQATLLKQEQSEEADQEQLTIQYQLEKKEDLDKYLIENAPKMREDGIKRFKDKFSATRRVFKVQEILQ